MNAKLGIQILGSVVIALAFTNVVSAGGQLFVTYGLPGVPIRRLDSQTFELLGELPGTERVSGRIQVDPYRRFLIGGSVDLNGNAQQDVGGFHIDQIGVTVEPFSNSVWNLTTTGLFREPYDRNVVITRPEARFEPGPDPFSQKDVVATEHDVFFRVEKTIRTLNSPIYELPFTAAGLHLSTVEDDFLYFSYQPSISDWHNIYRIRTDGTGFEELASDIPNLEDFDVDPNSETIFFERTHNPDGSSNLGLFSIGFGETTPITICEMCAEDVDFVADDEWLLPGDTDLDHDIDITDFNALASNFSPELERDGIYWYAFKTVRQGDFNGDWRIDVTDFNTLADNFAPSGYPGPFDESGVSDVPEPSAILLASLTLIFVGVSFRLSKNDRD